MKSIEKKRQRDAVLMRRWRQKKKEIEQREIQDKRS